MISGKSSASIFRRVTIVALTVVAALLLTGVVLVRRFAGPLLKQRAIEELHDQFHADVEIRDFRISVYPAIRAYGSGLVLRYQGGGNRAPLISAREFSADASAWGLWRKPWKIRAIRVTGLVIRIPPKEGNRPRFQSMAKREIPVFIGTLTADDAQLDIVPRLADKPHHIFEIHRLVMESIGLGHPATYAAQLRNAVPPGEINAKGYFGPWDSDEPGDSPLAGTYTFLNADLAYFKGISGTLSSQGKFGGALNNMEVEGETDTPDFALKISEHPVVLHTAYSATVDGTNGDTLLHPVRATLLHTVIVANGGVVKSETGRGRIIDLDVAVRGGRLEDLIRVAVKGDKPIMTGAVSLHTKMKLPTGPGNLLERLRLKGEFGVNEGEFTDPKISGKVQGLSRRGEGKPGDKDAGSNVSSLNGGFRLQNATLDFRRLSFGVSGASVELAGIYGLEDEHLDFHGRLRLQAKLSQTVTGYKSLLLKPFDSFFIKNKATELPIKVTGTRSKPTFGLDFGHKGSKPK